MWKTLKTIATQSPWSNTRSLNKQHTNAAKQASWPTKKQLVTLRLSIWKYKCWLKSWKKLRGITVQFENKWSEENENGSRKLGWVSILKGKNVIFVHLGCIKGGSPLSKFPECKAFIVFSNYLFILISRFLYLPLEVNSSRSWMVKWWIPRKTRYFMYLAALLSEHFLLIRKWRCEDIDAFLCCLKVTIKHLFVKTHEAPFRNTIHFQEYSTSMGEQQFNAQCLRSFLWLT